MARAVITYPFRLVFERPNILLTLRLPGVGETLWVFSFAEEAELFLAQDGGVGEPWVEQVAGEGLISFISDLPPEIERVALGPLSRNGALEVEGRGDERAILESDPPGLPANDAGRCLTRREEVRDNRLKCRDGTARRDKSTGPSDTDCTRRAATDLPEEEKEMSQPRQQQQPPGLTEEMQPRPDHGEESYRGSGRLTDKATIITGADSGIGKAVAIAYAREGADVLISYLQEEEEDAQDTRKWVEEAGRKAVLVPGDVADPAHCRAIVQKAVDEFERVDVLVNNAAFQMTRNSLEEIPDEEWDHTIATNISAMFHLCKAVVPHMRTGSAIIGSTSVNSDMQPPTLLPYNVTKAGIANMIGSLSQMLAERGIRANSVAPGPIWTPLIPATMPPEQVESFGQQVPMGRPGQPAELAPVYVMLASDEASYVSGAQIAVTGGKPIL